jgi:phosphorylcholine metabolism protein LicD
MKIEEAVKLYKMIETSINIFKQHKITYWADGGTYLGAVRHKGIIPWDDDADLGILKNTLTNECINDLKKEGVECIKVYYGFKLFYKTGIKIKGNPWNQHLSRLKIEHPSLSRSQLAQIGKNNYEPKPCYQDYTFPFIDIFEYEYKKGLLRTHPTFKKSVFKIELLNELIEVPFGWYNIKIFIDYERYFNDLYGKDWNVNKHSSNFNHEQEKQIKKVNITPLTDEDRKPLPFKLTLQTHQDHEY